MIDAFLKQPGWLQITVILTILAVFAGTGIICWIKIMKAEKIRVSKDNLELEDKDNIDGHEQQN